MSGELKENLEAFNINEAISDMEKEIDDHFELYLGNAELKKLDEERFNY